MPRMIDPAPIWDSDDPAGSLARLREASAAASGDAAAAWDTQVARAHGLLEEYAEGHALLDTISADTPEVLTRVALERGRLLRSAGDPVAARPLFEEAASRAQAGGLDLLHVDALHMLALVAEPAEAAEIHDRALAVARASADPQARDWDASLLNNVGMAHADSGDFTAALISFEEALAARERIGDVSRTRVARWMVAWALRNLGRVDEALAIQRSLKAELEAAGEADPFVDEEIDLLTGESRVDP